MNHRTGGGIEDGQTVADTEIGGEQRPVLKAPVHPFLRVSTRRGSGVLKAILCTMMGGLATSCLSYIFVSPPGSQHQYHYQGGDGFHNYPSDTTTYGQYNDPSRRTEQRDEASAISSATTSASQLSAPPHVWSSHTGLSQSSSARPSGIGGGGLTRFGDKTLPSSSSSPFSHRHHFFSKSVQADRENAEGDDIEISTEQHVTNQASAGQYHGGVGHHRPMQGARPEALRANEGVAAQSITGDTRGLDILGVHRSCPPIFEGPECKSLSSHFQRTFGFFASAYKQDVTMSVASVKGYRSLNTCLPPHWDKPINLGPVTESLLRALPETDPALNKVFETCAIVGSSGHLLKFEKGPEIDAHELVLRFNSAPTRGFEKHVGYKTTHRLTNTRNFAYREHRSEHVFIHIRNAASMKGLIGRKKANPNERLYSLHPAWHRFMDRTFQYLTTSGLNGIIIALHKCKKINLYGFHVHPQMGALYHYYNPNDEPANATRDDGEWDLVRKLAVEGFVQFAEPCIIECHDGEEECNACITKSGGSHEVHAMHAAGALLN
eukprot:CAMPEP_0118940456 /NCGR_PEP_ID=MMETSP1169-20130426/31452_1 /TAXON_ID=36882 /ORGANISM="Pyramimonas obovata, Strain CCMP722" /LENGTH=548 /DNA_ID=CAMNT_0006884943 /DNA_START=200 /DNA_END=1846 /DNA_ORIENTATION=+